MAKSKYGNDRAINSVASMNKVIKGICDILSGDEAKGVKIDERFFP
jgi:hypothetical protein